jgi:5'-nucleotidase
MVMTLAVSAVAYAASDYDSVITIVHTNDVHSRVNGEAYVSSLLKDLKSKNENVLLVSAGDVLHGQAFATLSTGKNVVDVMNAVGYNYMALGNHDFNYGINRLFELEKEMDFKVIAANVVKTDSGEKAFTDRYTVEIGGVEVGLFGLSTPETATKTNPKNVEGYTFTKPVPAAEEEAAALKADGADVIVAVAHLGLDTETAEDERSEAVAAVSGVDVIIDGHSHTVLEQGKMIGNTLIAQTGEYLNNIGVVKIYLKDKKVVDKTAELIRVPADDEAASSGFKPDEGISRLIADIDDKNKEITSQVIGKTPVKLEGARENVRSGETNLTNLITEAMIAATGADAAIENGGGVRASIEAGDITKGNVLEVLPFGNYIITVKATGAELLAALEHGVDTAPDAAAHLSQVGGISVKYDSSKEPGSRVQSVTFDGGGDLDPQKTYTIALNDFMAAGGDNYEMFKGRESMIYKSLDESLIDYIASGADLTQIEMGRLVDVNRTAASPPVTEPAAAEPEPTAAVTEQRAYVVVSGDYLIKIAEKYEGVTWRQIAESNSIGSPYIIYPGQELLIP